jgi:hypothetical protein
MKKEKHIKTIYLIFGLFAFGYVLLRAIMVGITFDEVWTINEFVKQSVINILNYTPCDANNHIINTLLIKLFFTFGNYSLFVARLPNVLAFTIYLYYSYNLTYKYLSPLIGLSCFLLLLLNPFLLDFFSISRGYGLSLSFLLASLYYTFNYANNHNPSNVWKSLGFGAIAVLCNFSLLNYFVSLVILINVIALFLNTIQDYKSTILKSFVASIILIIVIYEPIRKLKQNGNLYYGGSSNFYTDTLSSLAKYTFYSTESNTFIFYSLNIFLFVLVLSIAVSFYSKHTFFSIRNIILSILILCILFVDLQHYFFGTLYLIDRTALFFYPLFILCFCFSLNDFSEKWYSKIIALILVSLFGVNFFTNANFYKTATWYFDAHSVSILNELNEKGKVENRKLKIDFSWPFQNSFDYYIQHNNYPFIEIVKNNSDRESLNKDADVYIYLIKSLEKVGYNAYNQKILFESKDTIIQYKSENIIVFDHIKK